MSDPSGGASTAEPPPTHRRTRVREVSSRFMSPLIQSNSTPERQLHETNRSLDKSTALIPSTVRRKQRANKQHGNNKENGELRDHRNQNSDAVVRVSTRPDTPIASNRIVPSRYKQFSSSVSRSNSTIVSSSGNGCGGAVTAAARLVHEATSDAERRMPRVSTTSSRGDGDRDSLGGVIQRSSSCPSSPACVVNSSKFRFTPDARSSMPDVEKWLGERGSCGNGGRSTGECARSLNFGRSGGGGGVVPLPPHPSSCVRSGLDAAKKGSKGSGQQEDVHSLKMLSNHYLQWRFANAKAEACVRAQKQEAEMKFCSLGTKISEMRDTVRRNHTELAVLRRTKTLTTIVEAQMPYLDEWSAVEEDYSTSLSEATNALLSCSARVPLSGEVRADAGELGEALNSALKMVELIGSHIQRFMQKAEEMDISVSELTKMAGGERALIEECGDLMSNTYNSQVKECSLRSTLVQFNHSYNHLTQKSGGEEVANLPQFPVPQ